jgi:hypothetical protein
MSNEIDVVTVDPSAAPPASEAARSGKATLPKVAPKKKPAIASDPGEYLLAGELLRRGYEAQLADKSVKDYRLLAGAAGSPMMRVQVRTVRMHPWTMTRAGLEAPPDQITVYVLLGPADNARPARFFITRNRDVAGQVEFPNGWSDIGSMPLTLLEPFENQWDKFRK